MTEFVIEQSDNILTIRKTSVWFLASLVGALFPLFGTVWVVSTAFTHPVDKFSQFLDCVFLCFMLSVLYRTVFWGRCLAFDKKNNVFAFDGHRICALSELTAVQMEVSPQISRLPILGQLRRLHLRTAQGKDITLKPVWKGNSEYVKMMELVKIIVDFVGVQKAA